MRNTLFLSFLTIVVSSLAACAPKAPSNMSNADTPVVKQADDNDGQGGTQPGLIISEIVAKSDNNTYLEGNDWIELYNAGTTAVDLSGYWLADSTSEQFSLLAGRLNPGKYIVIAAVGSEGAGTSSVPFKLGSEDSVLLYLDSDLVDSFTWADGEAAVGKSFGLIDGVAQTTFPTPNSANQIQGGNDPQNNPSSDLVISEVVAKSYDDDYLDGNDWIEIYNTGTEVVDLSNYRLADSSSAKSALPMEQLNPGEYLIIAAVDPEESYPSSVPFKLGAEDSVLLYLDGDLIDSLAWLDGDIYKGNGYGLVDGSALATSPTPGLSNKIAELNSGPAVDPAGSSDLIINEIVAKSDDDAFLDGSDWIELYNAGTEPVNLSGYLLADSGSEQFSLPVGWLEAGEYFVIAAVGAEGADSSSMPFKLGSEDAVLLYLDDELVGRLSWADGEALKGNGYGLVEGVEETTIPTPGAENKADEEAQGNPDSGLMINEIVAKSDDDSYLGGNDWIEIYNAGTETVDLSQYTLADSGSDKIALPAIQLSPGEYLVIAAVDSEDTNPPSPFVPFKLGSVDSVQLYLGADLVARLAWSNGDAGQGSSYGFVGGVAQITTPTPGQANAQ